MRVLKNRIIALLLIFTMVASGLSGCGVAGDQNLQKTSEETDKLAKELSLPEVGAVISGFTVKRIMDYPRRNGVLVEMEYEKTGTPLFFLANEDENKAFNASYLTRTDNNKGIPHIFEHITLSGSTEYPNSSLFDAIINGTYSTFVNAFTDTELTVYEFSSLSDEELLSIARFYLSGLSDPLALKNPHPLGREAYRYQLYDENDDISVTGAVFNEMEASNSSIDSVAYQELVSELYPGSYMSYNTGGVRDDIISVNLEDLQAFHDKYYHPSNMVLYLYGNVDYVSFLEFLDNEYLSKYDKKEINIDDVNYKPWKGYKESVVDFPVEEGTVVENESETIYAMSLPDISDYDYALVLAIFDMLCQKGSSLSKRIEKEYPSSTLCPFINEGLDVPSVGFCLNNSNEGDEKSIKRIVNEELEKIIQNGFDQNTIDVFANKKEAELLTNVDAHDGIDELANISYYLACHKKSIDSYFEYLEGEKSVAEANKEGRLQELVKEYLINPETSVALSAVPRPGLYEEKWSEHEQILSDMKAHMSAEDIQELINSTLEFDEWSEKDAEAADVSEIAVVDVEDLDVSVKKPDVKVTQDGNVSIYSCEADDIGYVTSGTMLNADCVPAEKIYDFMLASALLGNLSTKSYDESELAINMDRDLYDYSINSFLYHDWSTGEPHMTLRYNYTALSKNIRKAAGYFDEIINSTVFSDTERIKYLISAEYNNVKNSINDNTIETIETYELALQDDNYKIDYYTKGFKYLAYLKELTQMSDEDVERKIADIEDVIDVIKNQNDAIIYMYGGSEDLSSCQNDMIKVISGFSNEKPAKTDFAAALPALEQAEKIAIITNDSSVYNGVLSSAAAKVMPYNGTSIVANRYIQSEIAYPAFRYDIGAYGDYLEYTLDTMTLYIYSYRDNQVAKTFEFIDTLPDAVRNSNITTEELEFSKLQTYSGYASPEKNEDWAISEIVYTFKNHGSFVDMINSGLEQMKRVTAQDIYDCADAYQVMVDEGIKFSFGNGSKIKEAGGYDLIFEDLVK